MLERESYGTGWQVSLRPHGVARFLVVGFLCFWLCGWAVGELFAAGTLIAGLRDLLAPELEIPWLPHMKGRMPSSPWPVLGFLAVWLAFWTLGGLFAMAEVLRAFIGVDYVRWDHEGIEVVRRAGPFGSRARQAWSDVNELLVEPRGGLSAHTRRGLWRMASLGDEEDKRTLADWLGQAWREARGVENEPRASAAATPEGWVVDTSDEGRPMLVADPKARRIGAVVLGVISVGLGIVAVGVGFNAQGSGAWLVAVAIGAVTMLGAVGTGWLALGRVELRPSTGTLRHVRRFMGREWLREFSPARLSLSSDRDSDGDQRWTLTVSDAGGKMRLGSDLHVPGGARHIGLWLSSRMDVELEGLPEHHEVQRRAS